MRKRPINDFLRVYTDNLTSRNLARRTIEHVQRTITDFIMLNQIIHPEDILPRHIERWEETLIVFATNTRRGKLATLRDFLLYLRGRGVLLFDASAVIELPRPEKVLPRAVLTEEEISKVLSLSALNHTRGLRIRAMIEILYGTGIRRNELLNLDLYDLDIRKRTLFVRQGKGRKDRLLPVPRTTVEYVRAYMGKLRKKGGKALFLDGKGDRLNDNELQASVYRIARQARDRLDITKPISCHVFRHSIATHLVQRGVDIRYVQAFLGHADLSSTQIYTRMGASHLSRELMRKHPREKMKIPLT